jgi:formate/nitrite transporter FocA (FNT family)
MTDYVSPRELVQEAVQLKIAAMWLPILTFFALGFEHSVVNMYILPPGMMLGAAISVKQILFWNLLPVTLGNIIAGALFTGMALYATYATKSAPAVSSAELAVAPPVEQTATLQVGEA